MLKYRCPKHNIIQPFLYFHQELKKHLDLYMMYPPQNHRMLIPLIIAISNQLFLKYVIMAVTKLYSRSI